MSEWTIDTFKEHIESQLLQRDLRFDERFLGQKEAIQAALIAVKAETDKLASETDNKFASVNEFRGLVKDTQSAYITRAEILAKVDALTERLNGIEKILTLIQGKSTGIKDVWGYVIGAAAVGGFIIKIIFP